MSGPGPVPEDIVDPDERRCWESYAAAVELVESYRPEDASRFRAMVRAQVESDKLMKGPTTDVQLLLAVMKTLMAFQDHFKLNPAARGAFGKKPPTPPMQ